MNFITANNRQPRAKNGKESFLSVLFSVSIIVFSVLLALGVVFGSGWLLLKGFDLFVTSELEPVTVYQSIDGSVRFIIESAAIILGAVLVSSVLVWANINSKK